MPVTAYTSTTLSAAIDAQQTYFQVASTANVVAGYLLVVQKEAMKVISVPSTGFVKVIRGTAGTKARAHPVSAIAYTGTAASFSTVVDQAIALIPMSGAQADLVPDILTPGDRLKDGSGNEFVLLDFTETVHKGVTVVMSLDGAFTAAVLAAGAQGNVAVVAEETSTSDQMGWCQIYGYNAAAQTSGADSAATSAYLAVAAASVSSPNAGMNAIAASSTANYFIQGMFIVGAASTTVTQATSCTGVTVPVFLNYPWVRNVVQELGTIPS
jgi:hypothetical protein